MFILAIFFANGNSIYAQSKQKPLSSQSKHVGVLNKKGPKNYKELHKKEIKTSKRTARKMKGQSAGYSVQNQSDKVIKTNGNTYKDIHKREIKNSKTVSRTLSKYKRTTTDKYLEEEELATRNRRKKTKENYANINKTKGVDYKDIHNKKVKKSKQINNEMKNQSGGYGTGAHHTEHATKSKGYSKKDIHGKSIRKSKEINNEMKSQTGGYGTGSHHAVHVSKTPGNKYKDVHGRKIKKSKEMMFQAIN